MSIKHKKVFTVVKGDVPDSVTEPMVQYFPPGSKTLTLEPLRDAMRQRVPFWDLDPSREFVRWKYQKNTPCKHFDRRNQRHVWCESVLESDVLTMLEWDHSIGRVAAQPFQLLVPLSDGSMVRHFPDFACEGIGRRNLVVEVKNERRIEEFVDSEKAQVAQATLSAFGFEYAVMGPPEKVPFTNVQFLRQHSRPVHDPHGWADQLVDACTQPTPIGALAAAVGPVTFVKPVLFHLLWHNRLFVNIEERFTNNTLVWRAS